MSKAVRLEWELPDSLYDAVVGDEQKATDQAKQALVLDWVRLGRVSMRRGAELLGLSYRDFLDVLAAHRVPVCEYEEGWLGRELEGSSSGRAGER
jgi:predicted HTH domain antitoxin